jgi:hypothetical protein
MGGKQRHREEDNLLFKIEKRKVDRRRRRNPLAADLWDGSVNPQPSSSDTSKSNEQPYDA